MVESSTLEVLKGYFSDGGVLATAGLKLSTVIGGAFGGFISLRFHENLNWWEKWTTFLGGWALGGFLGLPLIEYLGLSKIWELGVALLISLFGMALAAAIIRAIREVDWGVLLSASVNKILTRIFGGKEIK